MAGPGQKLLTLDSSFMELSTILCCPFLGAEMVEMSENGKVARSTQISLHQSRQIILLCISTTTTMVVATIILSLDWGSILLIDLLTASCSFSRISKYITSLLYLKPFKKLPKRSKGKRNWYCNNWINIWKKRN